MKLLIIFIITASFSSCRKDYLDCKNITAKQIKGIGGAAGAKQMYFLLNDIDTLPVGIIQWDQYKVGDKYCY